MGQQGSRIKVTETDKAMLQLKMAKDELHKYSRRTETLIKREQGELKTLCRELGANKLKEEPRARLLLKRIHYQQRLLEQCTDQVINLETMVQSIEFKLVEKSFLSGLEKGNVLLKRLNKELNLERVESIMDDAAEQIDIQREIDETLSGAIVGSSMNDEIDRELELLDEQINGFKTSNKVPVPVQDKLDQLPPAKDLSELKASSEIIAESEGHASKENAKEEPMLA